MSHRTVRNFCFVSFVAVQLPSLCSSASFTISFVFRVHSRSYYCPRAICLQLFSAKSVRSGPRNWKSAGLRVGGTGNAPIIKNQIRNPPGSWCVPAVLATKDKSQCDEHSLYDMRTMKYADTVCPPAIDAWCVYAFVAYARCLGPACNLARWRSTFRTARAKFVRLDSELFREMSEHVPGEPRSVMWSPLSSFGDLKRTLPR